MQSYPGFCRLNGQVDVINGQTFSGTVKSVLVDITYGLKCVG